ncbi:MAG: ATP synthase F1 subunit delta [bacterium]
MANNARFAKRYARALFNSIEFARFEEEFSHLAAVRDLLKKSREIEVALVSPLFTHEEKATTISILSKSLRLSEEVKKYLTFLAQEGAVAFLDDILRLALDLYHERKRKAVATVITPVQFTGELQERLKSSLKKITAKDEVEIVYVRDASLLGGFVVKIGSTMYDSSLKGQLRLLKDELIKG